MILEDRVTAISNYIRTSDKKKLKAFLDSAGYYRRFNPNFGAVASPLTRLTKKNAPDRVIWTEDCQQAFVSICKLISNASCILSWNAWQW